jgi:chromosomal replication initiation ATPase DnaA
MTQLTLIHTGIRLSASDRQRAQEIAHGDVPFDVVGLCTEWCEITGVPMDVIRGPRRDKRAVSARRGLMWALRYTAGLSLPQIARVVSRDHTTVMDALRREEARRGAA